MTWLADAGIPTADLGTYTADGGVPFLAPVLILVQPADQSILAGQVANFSVTATGAAPLSYQWSKNGIAIVGATSDTYVTPAESTNDSGSLFSVAVSNTLSTVISRNALLIVGEPIVTGTPVRIPDSYNVYVNGVLNQNVPNPLYRLALITGLTAGVTYQIKIVAVSAGVEVAESDQLITIQPTSVMSTTPMKRILPLGNMPLN